MKIRNGFVSNSSSTSFAIYGVYLSSEELQKFINGGSEEEFLDDESLYEICDKLNGEGLSAYAGEDYAYVGLNLTTIGDNETGGEFKKRAQKLIEEKLGQKLTCSMIEETICT
jgi:hypothetical protein